LSFGEGEEDLRVGGFAPSRYALPFLYMGALKKGEGGYVILPLIPPYEGGKLIYLKGV